MRLPAPLKSRTIILTLTLSVCLLAAPDVVNAGYCTSLTDCVPANWIPLFIVGLFLLMVALPEIAAFLAFDAEAAEVAEVAAAWRNAQKLEALMVAERASALSTAEGLGAEAKWAAEIRAARAEATRLAAKLAESQMAVPGALATTVTYFFNTLSGFSLSNDLWKSASGTTLTGEPISPAERQKAIGDLFYDGGFQFFKWAKALSVEGELFNQPQLWESFERLDRFFDVVKAPRTLQELGGVLNQYEKRITGMLGRAADLSGTPPATPPADLTDFRSAAALLDQDLGRSLAARLDALGYPRLSPTDTSVSPGPTILPLGGTLAPNGAAGVPATPLGIFQQAGPSLLPLMAQAGVPLSMQWLVDPSLLNNGGPVGFPTYLTGVLPRSLSQLLQASLQTLPPTRLPLVQLIGFGQRPAR